jgi:hexosaminidase
MKTLFRHGLTVLACWACCTMVARAQQPPLPIIPTPVTAVAGAGTLTLPAQTTLSIPASQPAVAAVGAYLANALRPATGIELKTVTTASSSVIQLHVLNPQKPQLGKEGYTLDITPTQAVIRANTAAGLFYGVQSLLQLLPAAVESKTRVNGVAWTLPVVSVTDYPRFGWRGVMLDVSRHFFTKEEVKVFIDQIARYKYNRLHWHLTDDQGWRMEIKSLPRLTGVGAWRVPRHGQWGTHDAPKPGEAATDGGFYTQDDIKEVIAYARERFVEILPEIDVPGHSMAALAAYPELSCTQEAVMVNPGSHFSTWHGNGTFTMHIDNTLNPSNEKVYEFLDKVFTEVAAVFPFDYIHMGGDECYKGYWEKDPGCQALIKKLGIKDAHALQAYFNARVNKIVTAKKKKLIGWDEILEGGLAPGAAVMSWRGTEGGIAAAKQKHPVVMTPNQACYLDLYQGDPAAEPPTYSHVRLRDSYGYNPVPAGVDSTLILGGQGNLWTEQIPTVPQIEYMMYPRAFALSEVFWSPQPSRHWPGFVTRVEQHFERFDFARQNYARSMYDPIVTVSKNAAGRLVVNLDTEVAGLDIYYTLDNTLPNQYYPQYKGPVELPEGTDLFRVITYRNGKPAGKLISITTEALGKRVGK